jgi:hypothetical protein
MSGRIFFAATFACLCAGCAGFTPPSSSSAKTTPSTATNAVPSQPTNLQAVSGNATVSLMWSAVSAATSYKVARSVASAGAFALIGSPTSPGFTDTALKNGTKYYYVVSAQNSAGTSANSIPASATPAAPASPPSNPSPAPPANPSPTPPANPPATPPSNPPAETTSTGGEKAASAEAFVETVGVNVHLNYIDTPYGNFAQVQSALKRLGVRHIRSILTDTPWTGYYDRLNELGRDGIKSIFTSAVTQSSAVIEDYPHRVPDSFEGYEAPNEYDLNGGSNWASVLDSFMGKLYSAVKSNSSTSAFPIYGPSVTQSSSFEKTASTAPDFDHANLHNYFGGHNPGTSGWGSNHYGSYAWNLNLVKQNWGSKPIVSTETGYFNDTSKSGGVPEDVSGTYMPRLLFEQWMHGIQRTYIYELIDVGPKSQFTDATFGLMRMDFSPKPAFNAVQSVMQLLGDPGPSFTPGNLAYTLSGDTANVSHVLFQKRDGTFFLAIWVEEPSYDLDAKKKISVDTHKLIIKAPNTVKMTVHQIDDSGNIHATSLGAGQTQTLEVSDHVQVVEISD